MDPNATLFEIRQLTAAIDVASDPVAAASQGERLAELVDALDEWLSKHGFLPDDWQR
jgi:hypothetical protein